VTHSSIHLVCLAGRGNIITFFHTMCDSFIHEVRDSFMYEIDEEFYQHKSCFLQAEATLYSSSPLFLNHPYIWFVTHLYMKLMTNLSTHLVFLASRGSIIIFFTTIRDSSLYMRSVTHSSTQMVFLAGRGNIITYASILFVTHS